MLVVSLERYLPDMLPLMSTLEKFSFLNQLLRERESVEKIKEQQAGITELGTTFLL